MKFDTASARSTREVFEEIVLASRTKSKCDAIAAQLDRKIETAQVDADNAPDDFDRRGKDLYQL